MTYNESFAIRLWVDGKESAVGEAEAGSKITFRFRAPRRAAVGRINAVLTPDRVKEDGSYANTVRERFPENCEAVADPVSSQNGRKPAPKELSPRACYHRQYNQ